MQVEEEKQGVKLIKKYFRFTERSKTNDGKGSSNPSNWSRGKKVKRLYIEEASDIQKEFYLSCLIDRESSTIVFISSTEGGMDIEKVASETPKKIITNKIELKNDGPSEKEIKNIISIFKFNDQQNKTASKLIKSLYEIIIKKDASLIEINPLIITKTNKLICLDAKMNFDENAIFRRPEIQVLRDLNEEDPAEIEASKHELAYIKLNAIGCGKWSRSSHGNNGYNKTLWQRTGHFLDVGGGASKEKVAVAFKLILSDRNVKVINIFGGIMRCDVLAQGVVDAAKEITVSSFSCEVSGYKF